MNKYITYGILFFSVIIKAQTVTTLTANGPGNTYEDINSVLAPNGGNAIEVSGIVANNNCLDYINEITNNQGSIQEIIDPEMGNVFKFSVHSNENIGLDECSTIEQQGNEIKAHASSPDYLLGTLGETVEYKWSFKIPAGFQSTKSFTHIHQLRSVGGISTEESVPMITLTIYDKGSSNSKLHILYSKTDRLTTISEHNVNISDLEDNWVEVIETVTYGDEGEGSYAITITDIDTNNVLLSYSDNTQRYYKTNANFVSPKWGIYRSTNDVTSLGSEEILYGSFTVTETQTVLSNEEFNQKISKPIFPNPSIGLINLPFSKNQAVNFVIEISNALGGMVKTESNLKDNIYSISSLAAGIYFIKIINIKNQNSIIKKLVKI